MFIFNYRWGFCVFSKLSLKSANYRKQGKDCLPGGTRRGPQEGKRAGYCRPTFAIVLTAGLAGAIANLCFKRSKETTAAAAQQGPRGLGSGRVKRRQSC
jgi:hypothetical protein